MFIFLFQLMGFPPFHILHWILLLICRKVIILPMAHHIWKWPTQTGPAGTTGPLTFPTRNTSGPHIQAGQFSIDMLDTAATTRSPRSRIYTTRQKACWFHLLHRVNDFTQHPRWEHPSWESMLCDDCLVWMHYTISTQIPNFCMQVNGITQCSG